MAAPARGWQLRLVAAWRAQTAAERKRQRIGRVRLPPRWFRLVWAAVFAVRLAMLGYLLALSLAYWLMASPAAANTRSAYDLPGPRALLGISALLGAGAVVYAAQLAQMLRLSLRQRRLAFRSASPERALGRRQEEETRSLLRAAWRSGGALYGQVLGPKGLLGIEHPFFFQVLVLRELSEVLVQGYQTYTLAALVPRRWISDLAAALLVLNCWSTLLVHALGPRSPTARRVLCLAVDTALDLGWSVVIPVCLLAPYAAAYDPALRAFPDRLLADYRWQLSWEMDVQQVCITSALDLLSAALPCAGILLTTRSIARVVVEKRARVHPERALPALSKREGVRHLDPMPGPSSIRSGGLRRPREPLGSHLTLFFLLGLVVLAVHAYAVAVADDHSADAGCVVHVRPWLARRHACIYANVDCSGGSGGDDDEHSDAARLAARLAALQPGALRYLVLSHAARLRTPAAVARFPNLRVLEVYNSTLADWPLDAAITARAQPQLRRFGLVRTNLSRLPDALVAREAPFVFVNLVATNLSTVPDAALAGWRALRFFNMERGALRALPPAIAAMPQLQRLSVCGNAIAALPPALPGAYAVLNVARNPLRALPESLRDASHLRLLTFERTRVAAAPQWLRDAVVERRERLVVAGAGSPFCTEPAAAAADDGGASIAASACAAPSRYVDCHFLLEEVARFMPVARL